MRCRDVCHGWTRESSMTTNCKGSAEHAGMDERTDVEEE
jgi:hypothetical protein